MRKSRQEEIQEKYWNKVARIFSEINLPFSARFEQEEFFKFLSLPKGTKALEIGCGTGRWTLPLLRRGIKITATEISSKSLDKVRTQAKEEKLLKNLVLIKTNFEEGGYKGEFDAAFCFGVIHHFDPAKKEAIVGNICKALKKNGVLVSLEPNPLNPLFYLLYLWRWLTDKQGKNRWETEKGFLKSRAENLRKLYQRNGLSDIEIKRFALIPTKYSDKFEWVVKLNEFLLRLPLIQSFSAYIWIKGKKL